MAALPSGTVTLLFTDIEGSTRLWESRPEQTRDALVRHDELVRSAVEAAGGHVFKARTTTRPWHYREALAFGNRLGDRNLVSFSLLGVAYCTTPTAPEFAAALLGTADALIAGVGGRRDSIDEWLHADAVARIRNAIGETAFQELHRRGSELPMADAIRAAMG